MSESKDLLKIGDFARLASTNLRTLRYYEEIGLLTPALRSEGGFRYYRTTDINRVSMIRNLQELGLQLEQIGELLRTRDELDNREVWVAKVRQVLTQQEQLIDDRIAALQRQKSQIHAAHGKLGECEDCEHCPKTVNNFCEPCQNTGEVLPEFLSALF